MSCEIRELKSLDGLSGTLNALSDLPSVYGADSLVSHLAQNDWLWGIFVGEQFKGFSLYRPVCDEAELLYFYILPTFRHHGYGASLLLGSMQLLKEREMKRVFLEVSEVNQGAFKALHKRGLRKSRDPRALLSQWFIRDSDEHRTWGYC